MAISHIHTHLSCICQQMSARHLQARQGKQHDQLQRILCQPAKAHVGLANLLLDHPERVLAFGAQLSLGLLDLALGFVQ